MHIVAVAVSASVGAFAAPLLPPNARTLLLAIALVVSGIAAVLPQGVPTIPGRLATAAILLLALTLTDRASFLTLALAASSGAPWLTASGAAAGSISATTLALADPAVARVLPIVGRVGGGVLLIASALTALRLA